MELLWLAHLFPEKESIHANLLCQANFGEVWHKFAALTNRNLSWHCGNCDWLYIIPAQYVSFVVTKFIANKLDRSLMKV